MSKKFALMAAFVFLSSSAIWAQDVQTGNWKLNLAKSTFKTSAPPKSQVVTIVPDGKDGVKLTVNVVTATGEKSGIQYAAQYDGKEYPRTETGAGAVHGQTVTVKRVNKQTVERIAFLKGKKLITETWEISGDGKTRTVKQTGVGPDGKIVDNTLVYDKQ